MKSKIFAGVTVISIVFLVIFSTLYIEREIDDMILAVSAIEVNDERAASDIKRIREKYEGTSRYISIFVTHDDLTNIEDLLAELEGCLSVKDTKEAYVVKMRLINSLEHLRRLSGINLESII